MFKFSKGCFLFLFVVFISSSCQRKLVPQEISYTIEHFAVMPEVVNECSGFIFKNHGMVVINDGGSGPLLYFLNREGTDTSSIVKIEDATNVDWEAISEFENEWIVGDFGNNVGKRKDLSIYHIDKENYKVTDKITFSYPEQIDFESTMHNFDCEGMVVMDGSYYLFTKNRGNKNSNIYSSPLHQSEFTFIDSIPVPGMVTDAYFHKESNKIILLCYNYGLGGFKGSLVIVDPSPAGIFKVIKTFDIEFREQFEAITLLEGNTFLIGSENGFAKGGNIYKVNLNGL